MSHTALVCAGLFLLVLPAAVHADGGKRPMKIDDLFRVQARQRPADQPRRQDRRLRRRHGRSGQQQDLVVALAGRQRRQGRAASADQRLRQEGLAIRAGAPTASSILFESNRSGDSQLWVIDVDGGEARQLTTISTEAGNAIWSPDGKADRLRLGRLPGILREAVQGERRRRTRSARKRPRRTRSRRRSSRSCSTATGTPTSRTSGSTCS